MIDSCFLVDGYGAMQRVGDRVVMMGPWGNVWVIRGSAIRGVKKERRMN